MNEHFITGFVKAAQAVGMTDEQITNLLKQANDPTMGAAPEMEAAPEMGEQPEMQAPPEMGAEQPSPEGGEQELESLLSQMSPEEIEQLATELASEMQGQPAEEDEATQIPELAAAIEQHLGQHPDVAEATAPAPDMPEEVMAKQSAINFIKSAEYVEGFLEQAVGRGMNLKQAVELYDTAFSTTLNQLKTSELKGDQHKLDTDNDGKIEAEDLKKLREGKKETSEEMDEKTAAYYEGVIERCREYGMTDAQAIEFVKAANSTKSIFNDGYDASQPLPPGSNHGFEGLKHLMNRLNPPRQVKNANAAKNLFEGAKDIGRSTRIFAKKHPWLTFGAGAAAGMHAGRMSKEDKESKE
jgi:DNA-binding transcriptional regulator YhcF (GntR family)